MISFSDLLVILFFPIIILVLFETTIILLIYEIISSKEFIDLKDFRDGMHSDYAHKVEMNYSSDSMGME
jgi:hypothetical protein